MQSHTDSLEQIYNKLQQSYHVFDDSVACYVEIFNSENLKTMICCKSENKIDDQMVLESAISFVPTIVLLQQFYADFQSFHENSKSDLYERKNTDERKDSKHINHLEQSHNVLDDLNIIFNSYKDPFASCLQVVNNPKVLYIFSIESVCKFSLKFPSNRLLTFPLKDMQKYKTMDKELA
jgi:hypothetical protein